MLLQQKFVAFENRFGRSLILFLDWNSTTIDGWMDISDILVGIHDLVGLASSHSMVLRCGVVFFSLSTHFAD